MGRRMDGQTDGQVDRWIQKCCLFVFGFFFFSTSNFPTSIQSAVLPYIIWLTLFLLLLSRFVHKTKALR